MKANWGRGWLLGCLVACLGATTAGCSDSDSGTPPPLTDLQRGTMAAVREDACGEERWVPLDLYESLGILVSVFPAGYKRAVDCTLAAHNCREVEACMALYLADDDKYENELEQLPECGSEKTNHCEGNLAKYCLSHDSKTYYEASYDCTLAGATCVEGQSESGTPWAECQAPQLKCEGPYLSYCEGTRAVVCEESQPGVLSPWVYDCADAFGSHCIAPAEGRIQCEGPLVGERDCHDGKDGDGDGKIDCMDDDCSCSGEVCDDGIDNEGDGKVDCDDESDCFCP